MKSYLNSQYCTRVGENCMTGHEAEFETVL